MKRIVFIIGVMAALFVAGSIASAQAVSEKKLEKDAKAQAKLLVKQGWMAAPGKPGIEMQQLRALKIQNTFDENYNPKFFDGSGQAIGEFYDAAKFQATELAKIDLAGKIASEVVGLVDNNIGNTQLEPGQAASIAKSVGNYKSIVAAKLTNIISVIEMYKVDKKTNNTTVQIGIFYNKQEAMKAGINVIREELKKESEQLGEELDKLLDLK